ncbi:helix-turn-helix domain-containing protein [Ornithinimicrobium faecis]|uniref:Helix-turn-helix domain-containing protein n=1 Tax=Ornithinimicrobium faecis TaxID=2934158 RepID=A0ABY4YUF7_9MICO|nr:helix-turn-helix domain-containing protein [Ornithinimicrobium sp. HY1793]USQ80100.1 helix-turn-helix domain-containing protein [Ornithinimicrobium sp. HY1793]
MINLQGLGSMSSTEERRELKRLERETFGHKVREVRRARGLKQADVAEAAGMSRVTLSKVENGEHDLAVSFVRPLAAALGVPTGVLFTDSD